MKSKVKFICIILFLLICIQTYCENPYSTLGVINDNNVRIRSEPNTSSNIVGMVNQGAVVNIYDIDNIQSTDSEVEFWLMIKIDSNEGWIFGKYVDVNENLFLPFETNYGDRYSINTYESSVYTTAQKTNLFDSNLNIVKVIDFGTELLLAQNNMISLSPDYEKYLKKKFVFRNKKIESFCPVQTLDNHEIYLVSENDISTTLLKDSNSVYFLKRKYIFSTNYVFGKQLFISPLIKIVELKGSNQSVLWSSKSNITKSSISIDLLFSFTIVDNLFICRRYSIGGRIGAGGGSTGNISIMKKSNGVLQEIQELELSHFED